MGISSCFEVDENTDSPRKKEKTNKKTISENSSKKLYNSIVRINTEKESISATGFFLKLKIKNKTKNYLVTFNQAFDEKFIQDKKSIKLYYGQINEEKNIEIKLDEKKRDIKYLENPFNITLIEILKGDKISQDRFLLPDINYKKEGYNSYINKNNYYYLPGYTPYNERHIFQGKITEILEKPEFKHSLEDTGNNSGAPICLEDNLLVVGIHKKTDNSKKINYGIFLGYILDNLEKEGNNKENNGTLLENIESNDIIKKAFNYLEEKIKLKVIKYNDSIKNLIDININNYIFFTNKYIEYDKDKKGKEYNNNDNNDYLEFEGEYLNGERNGKGKEYYQYGRLKFEGEYLKGKRQGKGKEYYNNSDLKFEGEYLNGKKWNGKGYNKSDDIYVLNNGNGNIKEYNNYDYLIFEGEYLNGERHGKGKEYYYDGKLIFEGEYLNGKRNGKGKEFNYDGQLIFEGEYLNGKRWNGKGYNKSNDIIYVLKNGKGNIKEYNDEGKLKFEGEYLNGEINRKGKEYYEGNLEFEGEYLNGKRHGKGKEYNYDGKLIFEGEFLYGSYLNGIEYLNEIKEFEGDYLYGQKFNGKGYDPKGNIIYILNKGNGRIKEYDKDNGKEMEKEKNIIMMVS